MDEMSQICGLLVSEKLGCNFGGNDRGRIEYINRDHYSCNSFKDLHLFSKYVELIYPATVFYGFWQHAALFVK